MTVRVEKKHCLVCNKVIYKISKTSKKQWNSKKYCSVKCKSDDLGKKFKGNKSPVWVDIKRKKECLYCKKGFLIKRPSLVKRNVFCSQKCFHKSRKDTYKPWNIGKIEWIMCKNCGNATRKWRTYCSPKCYLLNKPKKKLLKRKCENCKKDFLVTLQHKFYKNCSKKCARIITGKNQRGKNHPMFGKKHTEETIRKLRIINRAKAQKGENSPNWKGGVTTFNKLERARFQKTIQKLIFERDNYTCQICLN